MGYEPFKLIRNVSVLKKYINIITQFFLSFNNDGSISFNQKYETYSGFLMANTLQIFMVYTPCILFQKRASFDNCYVGTMSNQILKSSLVYITIRYLAIPGLKLDNTVTFVAHGHTHLKTIKANQLSFLHNKFV